MAMKPFTLTLGILFSILLMGGITSPIFANSIAIPLSRESARNQVLDFYAGGSSDSYTLTISPQGGTMSSGDYTSISWMPWSYVTAQWSTGTVYIILLVNVTQTNFRIGFLYLTNSSNTAFILRYYDYGTNALSTLNFQGLQHVYNRTVPTSSIEMPQVQIPAVSQTSSGVQRVGIRVPPWFEIGRMVQRHKPILDLSRVYSVLRGSDGLQRSLVSLG